jgi:hypothetical protein
MFVGMVRSGYEVRTCMILFRSPIAAVALLRDRFLLRDQIVI